MDKAARGSKIPVELRIGIIGKWNPDQHRRVAKAVLAVRVELAVMLRNSGVVQHRLIPGLSPEAEDLMKNSDPGDLSVNGSRVEPMFPGVWRYLEGYNTKRSRRRFRRRFEALAAQSEEPKNAARQDAEKAIQECNVLIAVWHPVQGYGEDTAAPLMAFALRMGRTTYWIDPNNGKVRRYDNHDDLKNSLLDANGYNGESASPQHVARAEKSARQELALYAFDAGIHPGVFRPLLDHVLPHLSRAEMLASRIRNRYVWYGLSIYALTFLSIVFGAGVSLFQLNPNLAFVEVGFLLIALGIVGYSEFTKLQQRWIDCRFLAERLRAAVYLFVAGVSWQSPGSEGTSRWTERALSWICQYQLPEFEAKHLEAVKQFTREGWVLSQKTWFEKRRDQLQWAHGLTMALGGAFFLATLLFAYFHARDPVKPHEVWWGWLGISSAAGCLCVAGFRDYRVFRPISIQYGEMADSLTGTVNDINAASDPKALAGILAHALAIFISEHERWRVLVHVHEPHESI